MDDSDVIWNAVAVWGESVQLEILQEECAELIAKVSHYKRGRCDWSELMEEVVDVHIMLEQIRQMDIQHTYSGEHIPDFDEWYERKMNRLRNRLKKEE